ncbi:hypothetical protein CAOG_009694 [Capsaspora owczarzaki ATCC 30864]|uniref:NOD3 protein n=1 Tax=Capsaspora owczarzaki (strain ATCC 30864) TaxID=595528 RepID=A0A0D2X2J8_CAPO3|nr:hypothetical protein CAOG_009694 [Capsaspora owczarzaki ATCC 30864]
MSNTTLTRLVLENMLAGDAGATAIAEALKVNKSLRKLCLTLNQIGDAGAQAIAKALQVNTTLTNLLLWRNQIGDAGAQAIAEALKVNTTLKELHLDYNQIGDAAAIYHRSSKNGVLTEGMDSLNQNQIGDAGAQAIAEAFKVNTRLAELNLDKNHIGDVGAQAIAEVLKVNTTLLYLNLEYNCIGNVGVRMIDTAPKVNGKRDIHIDRQINPLAFSMLPRLAAAEDLQAVFRLLVSGPELEAAQAPTSLPALPVEIAERMMDEAYYWQGVQHAQRECADEGLNVTVPRSTDGSLIRVKAIQVLRDKVEAPYITDGDIFDVIVRDEQGAVRYECAAQPTVTDSTLGLVTILPASSPIIRQMREGWQVQVRPSKVAFYVVYEALYVGYI